MEENSEKLFRLTTFYLSQRLFQEWPGKRRKTLRLWLSLPQILGNLRNLMVEAIIVLHLIFKNHLIIYSIAKMDDMLPFCWQESSMVDFFPVWNSDGADISSYVGAPVFRSRTPRCLGQGRALEELSNWYFQCWIFQLCKSKSCKFFFLFFLWQYWELNLS